jgi:hypothetical protein
MFVKVALFLFAILFAACSSEPVGTGFSSEVSGSEAASVEASDATGGEPRPHPVMCESGASVGSPEQESAAWRLAWVQFIEAMEPDYAAAQPSIQLARNLRHAVYAPEPEMSCFALRWMERYGSNPCNAQSIEARAIMRCHLEALATRCGDQALKRYVHFVLYQNGCGPRDEYQP